MALTKAFPSRDSAADATDIRKALAGLVLQTAGRQVRSGLLGPRTQIVSAGSGMRTQVATFTAVTATDGGKGAMLFANDGMVSAAVTHDAAPGTGEGSRIDVIWAKPRDPQQGDQGAAATVFGIEKGTPAGSPVKPTISEVRAIEVGSVRIPENASTMGSAGVTYTQSAPYTAMAGGILSVASATEEIALSVFPGMMIYREDLGTYRVRTANAWQTLLASPTPTVVMAESPNLPRAQHVLVDGMVEASGSGIKGPGYEGIFTFPVGRRPARTLRFRDPATQQEIVIQSAFHATAPGRVDYTDNATQITVTLDGIRFRAAG